jgi:hypothetical protein
MALQDDIFDVYDALQGTPELKSFERIIIALNAMERDSDNYTDLCDALGTVRTILNERYRGDD